jgi:hypothetical protein
MSAAAALARPCRCARPMWDGESCVRCGRVIYGAPVPEQAAWTTPRSDPWTRAAVIRALRAFVFFRDRPPVAADWEPGLGPEWPTLPVVVGLFGSLPAALAAAGVID